MKKQVSLVFRRITGALVIVGCLAPTAQAQTIGEVVQRQNELSKLDHTIERNVRMIEIQEQELEFTALTSPQVEPEPDEGRLVQEQFFGQRPGGMNTGPAEPQKTPEQARAERILTLLDKAMVTEVFLPSNASNDRDFIAVIDMGNAAREVRVGSSIEGWTVTSVDLNRVEFRNREFDQTRTVYQAR